MSVAAFTTRNSPDVLSYAMTVNSPFDRLNLDPRLACEFLAVFARYEFALKASGFAEGDDAKAAWDRYARNIDAGLTQLNSAELTAAVDYLLGQPPKKQILVNGKLQWRDAPPDVHLPRAEQALLMVRRVRNNLFHGGKFIPGDERDQVLVNHSLVVLQACLPLDADVAAAYGS
jgi:hypothetical protein